MFQKNIGWLILTEWTTRDFRNKLLSTNLPLFLFLFGGTGFRTQRTFCSWGFTRFLYFALCEYQEGMFCLCECQEGMFFFVRVPGSYVLLCASIRRVYSALCEYQEGMFCFVRVTGGYVLLCASIRRVCSSPFVSKFLSVYRSSSHLIRWHLIFSVDSVSFSNIWVNYLSSFLHLKYICYKWKFWEYLMITASSKSLNPFSKGSRNYKLVIVQISNP
jgi:hypothetical protein